MKAIILSVGDELVLGQTVDTNTAWMAGKLVSRGISCVYHETIADDADLLTQAIERASRQADVVLVTGGIGPTDDDLTRQSLAAAMGVELIEDARSLAAVERFFKERGRTMSDRNRVQALHPAGTSTLVNTCGTAPGIKASLGRTTIYVTPGVPREMRTMYAESIEPELVRAEQAEAPGESRGASATGPSSETTTGRRVIVSRKVNTFGWGESSVADALGELMDRRRNPTVGTTVADGFVSVRIRSEFASGREAEDQLNETLEKVCAALGAIVFGFDDQTLQTAVVQLLDRRGRRLVTAESCTGGMLGQMITEVPGCSTAYVGGWIVYSNVLKMAQLDVPRAVIDEEGAVSEAAVRVLAENALTRGPADLSLSISGVAGPGGGTDARPVGTVWIGLGVRSEQDPDRIDTQAILLNLPGDRAAIRDRAAKAALQLLRLHLLDQPLDLIQWGKVA